MAKLIDITGKALSGEWGIDDETGDGIPVLRTTNFTNEGVVDYDNVVTRTITKKNIDEKYLRAGDIIIEKSGGSDKFPVGRVVYFDGPENTYLFNNFTGLLRVKDKDKWDPRYVFYSLFSNYRRGGTRAFENKTTGLHNLKTDDYVSRYEVAEADKNVQIDICEKLDKLYKVIKAREDELKLLDDLIKSRFIELFGDTFSNPKQWPTKTFRDASLRLSDGPFGSNLKSEHYSEDGVRVIRLGNIGVGEFIDKDKSFIPLSHYERLKKYTCRSGEIVIGTLGEPNLRACIIPDFVKTAVNKADCVHYIPNPEILNSVFVCQYINCPTTLLLASNMVHGQTRARVSSGQIAEMPIYIPPLELQQQFAAFVAQTEKSKFEVQKALYETQKLFDSLMQQYFG